MEGLEKACDDSSHITTASLGVLDSHIVTPTTRFLKLRASLIAVRKMGKMDSGGIIIFAYSLAYIILIRVEI